MISMLLISFQSIYFIGLKGNWDESSNKAVMGKTLNKATLSEMEIDVCCYKKTERNCCCSWIK